MPQPPNPEIVKKVKKLLEIAEELRQGKHFPVTRLTTIKSLCGEPEAAAAFALFLAQRIQSKMREEQGEESYRELVNRAVKELKPYVTNPTEERKDRLYSLCREIEAEQNEFKKIGWNTGSDAEEQGSGRGRGVPEISCQGLRGTDLGLPGCQRLYRAIRRSIWVRVDPKFCTDG